jgi:hypothetical protein
MPELAGRIDVVRRGGKATLEIDGKPFPWMHIALEGVATCIRSDEGPAVTLTIPADEVRVLDSLKPVEDA